MASKRRPLYSNNVSTNNSGLKFSPSSGFQDKSELRGTKPLPEPTSVRTVLLLMITHLCRKIVFLNTKYRVFFYLGALFLLSLLADVLPFPKTYFARKDNIFNVYFVKISWGWTLMLCIPYVVLTSFVINCGKRDQVLKHASRLLVATAFWYFWTNSFVLLESWVGWCSAKDAKLKSKTACISKGHFWQSIDVSGHTFILIYSSLILIEESRSIVSWEGISDLLREESYLRETGEAATSVSPLKSLGPEEFDIVKSSYIRFTPYIRALFLGMTFLLILWDCMLLSTILYFHNMLEKLVAGLIAAATWTLTYRWWYTFPASFPPLPGEGCFRYNNRAPPKRPPRKQTVPGPRFMGMPLQPST